MAEEFDYHDCPVHSINVELAERTIQLKFMEFREDLSTYLIHLLSFAGVSELKGELLFDENADIESWDLDKVDFWKEKDYYEVKIVMISDGPGSILSFKAKDIVQSVIGRSVC